MSEHSSPDQTAPETDDQTGGDADPTRFHRQPLSFVRRGDRLTNRRQRAWDELAPERILEVPREEHADRPVAERLQETSKPVGLLVNNAGFGLKTAFLDTDVEKEIASVDVMVKAVVVLSHAAGRAMRERGRGAIINVSSVAGFMASGTYSAAKSYVTVFSESLAGQLAGTGVTVTALCPGFTHTDFHASADIDVDKTSAIGKRLWLDADRLVRDCLADVDAGRVISVPGKQYKVATQLLRHVPRSIVRAGALSNRHRPRD